MVTDVVCLAGPALVIETPPGTNITGAHGNVLVHCKKVACPSKSIVVFEPITQSAPAVIATSQQLTQLLSCACTNLWPAYAALPLHLLLTHQDHEYAITLLSRLLFSLAKQHFRLNWLLACMCADQVLKNLKVPAGVTRMLFKTQNSNRYASWPMQSKIHACSYSVPVTDTSQQLVSRLALVVRGSTQQRLCMV